MVSKELNTYKNSLMFAASAICIATQPLPIACADSLSPAPAGEAAGPTLKTEAPNPQPTTQSNSSFSKATESLKSPMASAAPTWQGLVTEGDRQMVLQEYDRAEHTYGDALRRCKKAPHTTDELVMCMVKLANVIQINDRSEDSLPLYKKARNTIQHAYGKEDERLVPVLHAMADVYALDTDRRKAYKHNIRAAAIAQKNLPPLDAEVAKSLHIAGKSSQIFGVIPGALRDYFTSLSLMMRAPHVENELELESVLADYTDLLRKTEVHTKPLESAFQGQLLKDKLAAMTQSSGVTQSNFQKAVSAVLANNAAPANTTADAQSSNSATGDAAILSAPNDARGKDFYERMIAIDINSLGATHPTVADDLTALAAFYISEHRYDDARPLLQRALSIYRAAYGDDNMLVTRTKASLNYVNAAHTADGSVAVSAYVDNSSQSSIPPEAKNPEIAIRLNDLAFTCYCQGRLDLAATVYHWALSATQSATGEKSPLSAACLSDFAKVMSTVGQRDEADKMRANATEINAANKANESVRIY